MSYININPCQSNDKISPNTILHQNNPMLRKEQESRALKHLAMENQKIEKYSAIKILDSTHVVND